MKQDLYQTILNNSDIVRYINQYIDLYKNGSGYTGLCPFHNDTNPSFKVSEEKKIFKCFSCGKGGNIVKFSMLYHKESFFQSIKRLLKYLGLQTEDEELDNYYKMMKDLFDLSQQSSADSLYESFLINNRDISPIIAKKLNVGFFSDFPQEIIKKYKVGLEEIGIIKNSKINFLPSLVFWYFDNNTPAGFSLMRLKRYNDRVPKYQNIQNSKFFQKRNSLFGPPETIQHIKDIKDVFIVEGYFDLLRLYSKNIKNVIAISGTSFLPEHFNILNHIVNKYYIIFDGDEAGYNGALKTALFLESKGKNVKIFPLPWGYDPDLYYKNRDLNEFAYNFYNFICKYYKANDKVDLLLSYISRINDFSRMQFYLNKIKNDFSFLTDKMINSRLIQNISIEEISEKYKLPDFSIQEELIKAIIHNLIDENKINPEKLSEKYKKIFFKILSKSDLSNIVTEYGNNITEYPIITHKDLDRLLLLYSYNESLDTYIDNKRKVYA